MMPIISDPMNQRPTALKGHGFSPRGAAFLTICIPKAAKPAAEIGRHSGEINGKHASGAEARVDSVDFIPGINPWPTARIVLAMALLALVSLPALAQTAPSPSALTDSGFYRIAGTVVNAVTGEPVRRATVEALAEADNHTVLSVQTDSEGHFSLEGLPAAKYPLTASRRGFLTAFYDEHEAFNTAIVTGPDQETEHLDFRLVPGSVLHGVVTADGGDPVEGANVMLFLKPHGHDPGDRIREAGTTNTDDTGAYEFANLAPGEYLLAVKADPWYAMYSSGRGSNLGPPNDAAAALDVAYPVTYFDSATDEAAASTIVLAGGSREVANFNVHAVPALHIQVATPSRQDGSITVQVLMQTILGTQVPEIGHLETPGPAGMIGFTGVAPGHYELWQGDPPRIVDADLTSSQQIDPNAGTPTVAVAGTLLTTLGSVLAGEGMVTLDSLDTARLQGQRHASFNGGTFNFASVPPGAWQLSAYGPTGSLPVVSIAAGSRSHAGNLVTVGDHPLSLVVTVNLGGTRVEGFARKDGKGLAGVMMVLVPKNSSVWRSLIRRDQSDSDGSFSLRAVAPGQYTVVAIEDGWELDWAQPEVIARYLPGGIAVTVTDASGKLVTLDRPVPVQAR